MSNSYFNLASGPLQQNWSNAGLITADNNWSGVPSIEGFIGADLVTTIGANAGGVTASSPPSNLQVLANRNNPISTLLGGVAEFAIANPTIALQGSGQADAPHLILYLDATGQHDITVAFNARDIEAGNDNAVQQIAVQYRIGETGPWINLPPTGQPPSTPQIADATTGPGVADLVTPVSVVLPSAVNNQAQVQVRIITTNAVDNDEWVGIDDINVSSSAAPVNTVPGTQSVDEDSALAISGVAVADVDSTALTTTLTVANGTLTATTGTGAVIGGNGSGTVTIAGTAAQINAALAGLTYQGNLNFNGADSLTVATSDGTTTDTDVVAITVNAVDDAPVNTVPGAQSVDEDTALAISGVAVADVDSTALTTTLTVAEGTLNVTPGAGVTGNGTGTVTIAGTAAEINAALAGLTYQGNLNFNGSDALTVATSDGTATDTHAVAITVNAVDDAPVNTVPGAQSVDEDTAHGIAGVAVEDVDSTALTTTLTVANGTLTATTGTGAVIGGNGSGTVTVAGTAAQINAALAGLTYQGNLNFNGADTLTVATSDGTTTDTDVVAITVNAVDDAPVNTVPGAQSVDEDTALAISGVAVADVDSTALTTTLTVAEGTLNVTPGAGVTGNGTGTVTIAGTAAEINAALAGLTYQGNLNFNGSDALTVATSDGTATDTHAVAITVNAVDDAPVNTVPGAQSVDEDTAHGIAGVAVEDVDSTALTTTLTVANGTLTATTGTGAVIGGNGSGTVTVAGTAAQINAALAGLTYQGNLNFNGADTLTVATSDGTTTDTDVVAITVNAVDDAPVNTVPGAQSVDEDTALAISGVAVADVDSTALTTTLTVAEGTLNVTPGAGVTGNGTGTVTIAGTAAEINAALAGLTYQGNLDFNGSDALTVATSDGTATDTDTIAITVNVNAITAHAHCDFDGDSTSDILWQDNNGTAAMWLMDGTNSTFVGAVGPFNPGTSWEIKATGDFNGDGKDDIIWQGHDGTASMWLMDGTTATFVNAVGPFNPGPTWEIKGTGDFNGDGKDDIIWQGDDGTASMWLMDGTTATFVNAVGPFNPGPTWEIKGTGDFNGDGKADIIWQGDDGTAAMWLMDGINATFVGAVGPFNPGPSWQIKGTGDFNGDGKSDILWQGQDGTAAVWLMDGTNATFVGAVGSNPGPNWHIKGTGEFNGDGKSDITWQGQDGTAAVWLMDGTHATFVGAVGPFNPGATWDMIA